MGLDQYFFRGSDKPRLYDERENGTLVEGGKQHNFIHYIRSHREVLNAIQIVKGTIPRMEDASVWVKVSEEEMRKVIEILKVHDPEADYLTDELEAMMEANDCTSYLFHANW